VDTKVRPSKQPVRAASGSDQGFTLVELLIVIVVLGILSGIVVFGVGKFQANATTAACKADVATVSLAADAFDATTGAYPADVATLVSGGYLKAAPSGGVYTFTSATKTVTRAPVC
jgi:prepilin-type N-terminal cleavage/methylation domain-containing protein